MARPRTVGVLVAVAVAVLGLAACDDLPPGFRQDVVVAGLDLPTSFAAVSGNHVIVAEKRGLVRVVRDGRLLDTPLIDLRSEVNDVHDRGLTGMALDPGFASNGYLYLAYAYHDPAIPEEGRDQSQRVTRVTVRGDVADPASETVVLGRVTGAACYDRWSTPDCLPLNSLSHTVSNLAFGPDGHLWVSVGDGTPFDEVEPMALRALDREVLAGKLLRIDPATGAGVPGNPFYDPAAPGANRSRVWAMGFRNPFRLSFRPGSSTPYVGDVGWLYHEEVEAASPGSIHGWPCYEGIDAARRPLREPGFAALAGCQDLYRRVAAGTATVTPAVLSYPHDSTRSVIGGAFYTGSAYPESYRGDYVFGDYSAPFLRRVDVDQSNAPTAPPIDFITDEAAGTPVEIEMGPDGNLWYLSLYPGELRRIVYTGDVDVPESCADGSYRAEYFNNTSLGGSPEVVRCEGAIENDWALEAPTAGIRIDQFSVRWTGRHNLPGGTYRFVAGGDDGVRLRVDGTTVLDRWTAGAGTGTVDLRLAAGVHTVVLEHVDQRDEASARLGFARIGSPPTVQVTAPADLTRVADDARVGWAIQASDPEDGQVAAAGLRLDVDVIHYSAGGSHRHPDQSYGGARTGTFLADNQHGPNTIHLQLRATATDASGWSTTSAPVDVCFVGSHVGRCA